MRHDPIRDWMNNAFRYPLLSKDEVIENARLIRAWQDEGKNPRAGQRALDKMTCCNLRLVPKCWRLYAPWVDPRSESALDLLQCGAIGVRTAALKFDHTRGYCFSTVAHLWIRKEFQDWRRKGERTIRLSADCQLVGGMFPIWAGEFEVKHGRPPTMAEASERFGRREETIKFYLERYTMTHATSLNKFLQHSDSDSELIGVVEDDNVFDLHEEDRRDGMQALIEKIAEEHDLSVEQVYETIHWKAGTAKPKEAKALGMRIRRTGKRMLRTDKRVRDLLD